MEWVGSERVIDLCARRWMVRRSGIMGDEILASH